MGSRDLQPGHVVDRKYRVERKLGEGGMGTVYEVVHTMTQRRLALKVLRPEFAEDVPTVERFLREVQLASGLRHPNVVEVYDAGRDPDADLLYIAMELLAGDELTKFIADAATPRERVLGWIADVLPALAAAHDLGIVHRDLKPENLFLTTGADGALVAKLLDFGIARKVEGGEKLTQTGTVVGTPLYMSPEQALRPTIVDHRTDLWAIGVILYEVVVGQPPFRDESPTAIMLRAAGVPHAPIVDTVPGADPRLVALIDHCLQKNPIHRPDSAHEVHAALRGLLDSPTGDLTRGVPRTSQSTQALPTPSTESDLQLAQGALGSLAPGPAPSMPAPAASSNRTPILVVGAIFGLLAVAVLVGGLALALTSPRSEAEAEITPTQNEPPALVETVTEPAPTEPAPIEPAPIEPAPMELGASPVAEPAAVAPAPVAPEPAAVVAETEASPEPVAARPTPAERRPRAPRPAAPEPEPEPPSEPEPAAQTPAQEAPAPTPPRADPVEPRPSTRSRRSRRRRRSSRSAPPPVSF